MLWTYDANSRLIGKDLVLESLRARGEGETEDEMVREHHLLNAHETEQIPGHSGGQRSLTGYSP